MQRSIFAVMRSASAHGSAIMPASQITLATRSKLNYQNIKVRSNKFKSSAKEKRKQKKREKMGMATKDGEETPAFFLP